MASNRSRVKAPALKVAAPADADQAAVMVARIGDIVRDLALSEAAMNETISRLKLSTGATMAPLTAEMKKLYAGIQVWAEANRAELTRDWRTKTVKLSTGELAWRNLPPRVQIKSEETVLGLLESMGLKTFLRTRTEIDRDAIRANPDVARTVPGITIGSAGEEFIVSPATEEVGA
jgi:phage host-nuclease inhibitor protein Gam